MSANSRPPTNARRVALGLIGLVVGLVIIFVGLNALSTSDAPPPDTPLVQTGSLPPGTARDTSGSTPSAPAPTSVATPDTGSTTAP